MAKGKAYILIGPSGSGKTTLSHLVSDSSFAFLKFYDDFIISVICEKNSNRMIGNKTQRLENIIDFPGIGDKREIEQDLIIMKNYSNILRNTSSIGFILAVKYHEIFYYPQTFKKNFKEYAKMFGLEEHLYKNILIVVTNAEKSSCSEILNKYSQCKEYDAITRGIIDGHIQIIGFEKPIKSSKSYEFEENNKNQILKSIQDIKFIDNSNIRAQLLNNILSIISTQKITPMIKESVDSILHDFKMMPKAYDHSKLLFTSQNERKFNLKADMICIDDNWILENELLNFDAQVIWVLTRHEVRIEIKGRNPIVDFSHVKKIINGDRLRVLKISNAIDNFPDTTAEDFDRNPNFFRLESFCINGLFTEYVSFNNRFIDSIVYLNTQCGKIIIDPSFGVKCEAINIMIKLFVNVHEN